MRAHGRRLIFAAGIVAALLRAPGAPAQTTTTTTVPAATPGKCLAARLKAIGKEEKARLGCVAKAVAKNDTSSLADCQAKAAQKLEGAFAKATGCDGTASGCGALADLCIGGVSAALPDTGPSRCEAARLQAAGKKAAAQLGCHAKAALHGVAVDGDCLDRAAAKFSTAFGKVTGCSGDETAVEKEVDAECVGQLLALSGGVVTGLCPSLVAVRPYQSVVPSSYVPGTPTPLVLLLHGYGASGSLQSAYMGLTSAANADGFLLAFPDGTVDSFGNRFWNATDACCNFDASPVNDVAYLSAVIDDMEAKYSVDAARVFVVGHSNGGFMAYRLACNLAARVSAIVSLAGATFEDASVCQPALPVSVVEIHGDADDTILYGGGSIFGVPYPSAMQTVGTWVGYDGCTPMADTSLLPLDLDSTLAGDETTIASYAAGCQAASAVQLWTIQGGGHIPALTTDWFDPVWAFLLAHPRP